MRTKVDGRWMPVNAEQWFTIEQPGFIWNADVGEGTFMQFSGRDKFVNGKGNMSKGTRYKEQGTRNSIHH